MRTRSLLPAVAVVALLAACGPVSASGKGPAGTTPAATVLPVTPTTHASAAPPPATAARTTGACHEQDGRADKRCTPGVTNPDVTQATIHSTICVSGWTKTVRPPASYTDRLKVQQIAEYGYSDTKPASFEEDHLLPLELGGHPSDPHNLWPQPHFAGDPSHAKDQVENQLKAAVCAGSLTLDAARAQILEKWTH